MEPSLKRFRSVVSTTSVQSSLVEPPHRMQTISRVANPMARMIKAVTAAAEDVVKFKSSGSVFDRLGCDMMNPSDGSSQLEDNYQHQEQSQLLYHQRNDYGDQFAANMMTLEHETGFPSDSTSDNEGFDDFNVMGRRVSRASQLGSSHEKRGDDSLMVHYSVAKNDDSTRLKWNREQEQSAGSPNTSKILNISVNVNTWKPPATAQYQEPRKVAELSGEKTLNSEMGAPRSGLRMVNENTKAVKTNNANVSCFTCMHSDDTWSFCYKL